MAGLDWTVKLQNQISGPASAAAKDLQKLNSELQRTKTAASGTLKMPAAQGGGSSSGGGGGGGASSALSGMSGMGEALGAVTAGFAAMAAVIATVIAGIARITYGFGEAAIHAADFKENTLLAFETLTGSATKAKDLLADAVNFASKTPFKTDTIVSAYKQLLAGGFKPVEIPIILKGIGDLASLKNDPALIERLSMAFNKIQSQGKLTGEVMQQLAEAGLNQKAVFESLAKATGKKPEDIAKAVAAGQIDAKTAIASIVEAMKNTTSGGTLGSLMAKQAQTVTGLVSTLKSAPLQLLMDIDSSPAYKSIKGFLSNLVDALDPQSATGTALKGAFKDLFGAIFGGVEVLSGKSGAAIIQNVVGKVVAGLQMVAAFLNFMRPISMGFFTGLIEGFKAAWGPLSALGGAFAKAFGGDNASKQEVFVMLAKNLGKALGFLAVVLGVVVGAVALFGAAVSATVPAIMAAFTTLLGVAVGLFDNITSLFSGFDWSTIIYAFASAGAAIAEGLASGILGGTGWVVSAVASMGSVIIDEVKRVLGIASPSKVMAGLGDYTAQGFAQGVDAGSPDAQGAMADLVAPPGPGGIGGGGGGRGAVSATFNIHVEGGGGGEDLAAMIATRCRAEVVAFFDSLSDEMGHSPTPA